MIDLTRLLTRSPRKFRVVMGSLISVIVVCFISLGFIGGYAVRSTDLRWALEVERHKFDVLAGVVVERIPSIMQDIIDLQHSDKEKAEKIIQKEMKMSELKADINNIRNINPSDHNALQELKELHE